jgi:phytoene dehydrogenase-like protein
LKNHCFYGQEDELTDFDAIVVGSGAGGLSAALRLAQQKVSVLVLEAMPAFGGYINPFVRNGYRFDTGVHYLGKLGHGGTFRHLLELLELDYQLDFVELIQTDSTVTCFRILSSGSARASSVTMSDCSDFSPMNQGRSVDTSI